MIIKPLALTEGFFSKNINTKEKRLLNQAAKACPIHHSLYPDIEKEIKITFIA